MILWYVITVLLCAFCFCVGAILGRSSMDGDE